MKLSLFMTAWAATAPAVKAASHPAASHDADRQQHTPVNHTLAPAFQPAIRAKGTSAFLASAPHLLQDLEPARWLSQAAPDPLSATTPACRWVAKEMTHGLDEKEHALLNQTVADAKLVHKTTIKNMRRLLDTFPSFQNGIHGQSICASTIPDTPLVTTFNSKDGRFYGLILNPQRMVPVLAGTNDLWSACSYDPAKWNLAEAGDTTRSARWNHQPVVNADPTGELCHDMPLSMKAVSKDIAFDGGMHDFIERGKILGQNEIIVVRNEHHSEPLAHGIFVDLISNAMLMHLARPQFRPLLWLGKPVSNDRWLQAIQMVNMRRVMQDPAEFLEAKQLCADLGVPFLLRTRDRAGAVKFQPVDISAATCLADLPEVQALQAADNDPLIAEVVDKVARLFAL